MHAQLFTLLCVGLCCSLTSGQSLSPNNKNNSFSYLLFAQFWPSSSCIYLEEKGDQCYIPKYVHGWTIHGLWPSRPGSEDPQKCNSSMPFDYSKIESLRPQLDLNWHYYDKGADPEFLWKHEWEKHGTCAYSLPATRGELLYFSRTLLLHRTFNVTQALEEGKVVPSQTKTYQKAEILSALHDKYHFNASLVCDYDKKEHKTYIDQIYLCFDKSFHLMDCPPSIDDNSCRSNDEIVYMPFNQGGEAHGSSLTFKSEKSGN